MTRAIIVEDELDAQYLLSKILAEYCPQTQVVATAANFKEALQLLHQNPIDLLFLDINLGDFTGFQLLDQLPNKDFKLIVTTAYQEYALKAFKYAAVDYVLKPYSPKSIVAAVERVQKLIPQKNLYKKLDALLNKANSPNKIGFPTAEGIAMIETDEIIRVEADRSYSVIHLTSGIKEIISKSLKDLEALLPTQLFFRLHASHLINVHQLEKYCKEDGDYAVMSDKTQIPIARRRKNEFLELIKFNS